MKVVTQRLVLTRIAPEDTDDLVAMLLNPALYDFIGDAPKSAQVAGDKVGRWVRGSLDPDVQWINYVARDTDGGLVGLAQATVHAGTCELAYLVDPLMQGRGIATEMMRAFCAELRKTAHPKDFTANIYPGHAASEGVATALGLTQTEELTDGERVWRGH